MFHYFLLLAAASVVASTNNNGSRINEIRPMIGRVSSTPETADILPAISLLSLAAGTIEDRACRKQSETVLAGLRNMTTWAVKFYDASGKFPAGVLAGALYEMGNYDECLGIGSGANGNDVPVGIRGQYCLADVEIKVPDEYYEMPNAIWANFRPVSKRYQFF